MQMTWKAWLSGLLAAAIASGAEAVVIHAAAPDVFNLHDGLGALLRLLALTTGVKVAFWIKSHPAPGHMNGGGK